MSVVKDYDRIGKTAYISYKGGVLGEEVTDDHSSGAPFEVVLGSGQLPRGIEDALYEMSIGECRTLVIPCELGYGERDEHVVFWYLRSMIVNGYELGVDDVIMHHQPESMQPSPVWITDATDDLVKLDFNHPFAGKTLEYRIKLVDMR